MTNDFDIKLLGVEDLMKVLTNLEYKTQQKTLKKITRDIATNVFLPPLRGAHPYDAIRESMGVKSGRSRKNAVSFVGPRMGGSLKQRQAGGYSGWLANIVEYNKGQRRTTSMGYNRGVMRLAGRGRIRNVYKRNMHKAEMYFTTSVRKIIEREWKKFNNMKSKGIL